MTIQQQATKTLNRLEKLELKNGAGGYYALPSDLYVEIVSLLDLVAHTDLDKYYSQIAAMSNLRHKLNERYITCLEKEMVAKTGLEEAYHAALKKSGNEKLDERNMKRLKKMLGEFVKV